MGTHCARALSSLCMRCVCDPPKCVVAEPPIAMWDEMSSWHDPPPQIKCGCCLGTYNQYNINQQPSISCTWYYVAGCPLTMPWMDSSGLCGWGQTPWRELCKACETIHLGDWDNRTRAMRCDAAVKLESPTCHSCLARLSDKVQELVDDAWGLTRASLQQRVFSDKTPTPPLSHALFHINPLMDLITEYANPMARSAHHDAVVATVLPKPRQMAGFSMSIMEETAVAVVAVHEVD